MQSKTISILLTVFALAPFSVFSIGQTQKLGDNALPKQLSENEVQNIIKQTQPKSHVEATLKVSDARMLSAMKNAQSGQYQTAVEDVDVYALLIVYADEYIRKLSDAQSKDRNNCLKKLEQAIFKQSRNMDAVSRDLPFDYRESVTEKVGQVKKIRLRAVDDLLGGGQFIKSANKR